MPLWRRVLRLTLVFAFLGGAIAAVLFVELANIATRQQITDQNPQPESRQAGQHQELSSQIEAVSHWLTEHKESIDIISVIFVAVFTGTLWGATRRLADLAAGQASDMQKLLVAARNNARAVASQAEAATQQYAALKEQARETAAIVAATKAANNLTSRIFFAEQRPWVHIQDISIRTTANNGEWEFEIVVSNTGDSPAHFVRVSILKINEGDQPNDIIVRELAKNKDVRRAISITVFPRERWSYTVYFHDKVDGLHMKPFAVFIEYEFVAVGTEHITGGTIFCTQHGSVITYRRIPMSDFAT